MQSEKPNLSSPLVLPGASAVSRRLLVQRLLATALLPMVPLSLSGCGAAVFRAGSKSGQTGGHDAALLLPLSGKMSDLGQNMSKAASLATPPGIAAAAVPVYDTKDTPEGAAEAAKMALSHGAKVLFGPLRADQTPMVLAAAGKVPVVTFSNDDALAARGAFVMGVTPAQSVSATFSYARAQGMKRMALVATDGPYGRSSALAARDIAQSGGLALTATLLRPSSQSGLLADLKSASGGVLPDAVFIADGGPDLVNIAAALGSSGIKLMGGLQWSTGDVTQVPELNGAWFAAPPPDLFQPFSDRFAAQFGSAPGVVAALAYDAALIAAGLGNAGALNKAGLTRKAGFTGALGNFHFQADGRCTRDLAILSIANQSIVTLGEIGGT